MEPDPAAGAMFYYVTDPKTAVKLVAHGFADADIWCPQSTVTLFDRPPEARGGVLLRVVPAPGMAVEIERYRRASDLDGSRALLVPMALLRDAYVTGTPGRYQGDGEADG